MHVFLGDLGPVEGVEPPTDAGGRADGETRRGRARSARTPPEPATFQERSSVQRPPRLGGGSSEIAILDGDGRIVVVNQAWRETIAAYGFELRNAGVGTWYADVACRFLPELDRAGVELALLRLLSGGVHDLEHTYAIQTARGLRWRHVQISPLPFGTSGRFVAIHDDLTELAAIQDALQATSQQLLTARDDERQRIAIELHDSTSQHLAAISLGLSSLRRTLPKGGPQATLIDDIATSLNEALKETRVLSYLMKPRGLARDGLAATIRHFLEGFGKRSGLEVALEANPAADRAAAPLQHAALRIIQEALLNTNRHAQATRVSVALAVEGGQLTVSISDDGRGMRADQGGPVLGVGIPGMHARAQLVSGQIEIESDETGTRVTARLPLSR